MSAVPANRPRKSQLIKQEPSFLLDKTCSIIVPLPAKSYSRSNPSTLPLLAFPHLQQEHYTALYQLYKRAGGKRANNKVRPAAVAVASQPAPAIAIFIESKIVRSEQERQSPVFPGPTLLCIKFGTIPYVYCELSSLGWRQPGETRAVEKVADRLGCQPSPRLCLPRFQKPLTVA